jgi:murein DD-endopeptidase MepM/ murein hydrolase activator NlpD
MTTATVLPPSPPPSVSSDVAGRYNSSYTVRQGDSMYGLSRSYGVPMAELQQVNGITDVRSVRAGTVLRVPGNAAPASPPPYDQQVAAVQPAANAQPYSVPSTHQPTIINGRNSPQQQIAGRTSDVNTGTVTTVPVPPRASGSDKLRWPVSGKIITGFGQRNDGTHNDGINMSVPLGTSVHAAESGTVAYAGSELKGYGNLILLRHDNGWVTAYAHNDQLMVKRGDKVQRGQVIAAAGRTGSVDQPQVHFELRQGSKPVDPVPFLERM